MSAVSEVTVGIDIGTSSVKAIAADGDGNVVASARVPHNARMPAANRLEHDAVAAWHTGPRRALAEVGRDLDVRGVNVAAMVPSLAAVDADGLPITPGLLYGDERGRTGRDETGAVPEMGELLGFLRWCKREAPTAAGFWPAPAVANHALSGNAVMDTTTASTAYPLYDFQGGWSETVAEEVGVRLDQLPQLYLPGMPAARIGDAVLAAGCIDALAEQLVAGADAEGDVLVILGTTLIVWAVTKSDAAVPGYMVIPHTADGLMLAGGPSNAGGLFCNWVTRFLGDERGPASPANVPVWAPYPRGERAPLHDPGRRAVLADLDVSHDAAAIRRAAFEASGFVTRRLVDAVREHQGVEPRRVVATGGGLRVEEWVQAVADATKLPVDCVAVPEGAALGSAYLARLAAGLEPGAQMPDARRWARFARTVDPDPRWVDPMEPRYTRFLELS